MDRASSKNYLIYETRVDTDPIRIVQEQRKKVSGIKPTVNGMGEQVID